MPRSGTMTIQGHRKTAVKITRDWAANHIDVNIYAPGVHESHRIPNDPSTDDIWRLAQNVKDVVDSRVQTDIRLEQYFNVLNATMYG